MGRNWIKVKAETIKPSGWSKEQKNVQTSTNLISKKTQKHKLRKRKIKIVSEIKKMISECYTYAFESMIEMYCFLRKGKLQNLIQEI